MLDARTDPRLSVLVGDCREVMRNVPAGIVQTVITSPPFYRLRDYGAVGQLGLESTVAEYLDVMVDTFREVRRILRDDGTLFLNVGDSYAAKTTATHKAKDLHMVPARLAIALQEDGWFLRSDVVWAKNNAMPENVRDRPASAHEHIFLLTKRPRYFFDHVAIKEPETMRPQRRLTPREANPNAKVHGLRAHCRPRGGTGGGMRNSRDVWSINTRGYPGAHFATFPPELPRRCIAAGTSEAGCCPLCRTAWRRLPSTGAREQEHAGRASSCQHAVAWKQVCQCPEAAPVPCVVMDPFGGAGTTAMVALEMKRDACLIELNPDYATLAEARIGREASSKFQWSPA